LTTRPTKQPVGGRRAFGHRGDQIEGFIAGQQVRAQHQQLFTRTCVRFLCDQVIEVGDRDRAFGPRPDAADGRILGDAAAAADR
jgi:hypothetical protein